MEKDLRNSVRAVGDYNSVPTSITSAASVVTMVDGLSITKEADKSIWADGLLTYTITLTNDTENVYESPVITDNLDTTLVSFVPSSVTIDSVLASSSYEYNDGTGVLTVNLQDIGASESKTVKFQVSKKDA